MIIMRVLVLLSEILEVSRRTMFYNSRGINRVHVSRTMGRQRVLT